ncbi:MAG: hypothetical protein HUU22_05685 [Phycisphaerae bacterium]|nr:zinc-ribbon domain-containing protein [Phycisphaerae bacterium]NUQ45504.1 hypothetical protein [Phycisphaerae bacterium]
MKLRCPRCQQIIKVPDEWGGKAIRCSACNKAFVVPKPREADLHLPGEKAVDLESLAKLEARTSELDEEELAAAQSVVATEPAEGGETTRTCPHCNKIVPVKDPYVELLCSHCWKIIPALKKGAGLITGGRSLAGARNLRSEGTLTFYEGIGTALVYPVGAIGSLLTAALVAIGTILLPVALATALQRTTEQSQVGTETGVVQEELTGVEMAMMAFFWFQVLFFSGVGVHALVDVTRTSAIGQEKPPPLVWNPAAWGESLIGYFALLLYYAVFLLLATLMIHKGEMAFPTSVKDFREFLNPTIIGIAGVMTFFVPMSLIGMSCGKLSQSLNPVRVVRSIAGTHLNYVFLFLLDIVLMSLFVAVFAVIAAWFGGEIRKMQRAAAEGAIVNVAAGLVSWGIVMGVGFYSVYVLGRLHGLFARTYQKNLEFSS